MAKRPVSTKVNARRQAKIARDKQIIHKASQLKKRGLIYQSKTLRNKAVTDYMRKRVRDLEGVLEGRLVFVEVSKPVATRYEYEGGLKRVKKGGRKGVLVPTPPDGSKISVDHARGLIRNIKPLGDGHTLERVHMPVNVHDVEEFMAWLDSGEPDRLKYPNEYFGIRVYGNAALHAIPNSEELSVYLRARESMQRLIETNAELNPSDGADTPMALELFRVWPPEAWEEVARKELAEYRASPEYQAKVRRKRERSNNRRAINRAKKRFAKERGQPPKEGKFLDIEAVSKANAEKRKRKAREKKQRQRSKRK